MSATMQEREALLSALQAECQELSAAVKIFESQQKALISGRAQELQQLSEAGSQILEQLEQQSKIRTGLMQHCEVPDLKAIQALLDGPLQMRAQICCQNLIQQSLRLRQLHSQNLNLIAQGQRLNEASLESLVSIQQGEAPVYSDAGDYHQNWSPERRLCDYNA